MSAPENFARYLLKSPYHPRSNKHSNSLVEFALNHLVASCEQFQKDAATRRIVYELNRKVRVGPSEWNVDLAVGPPGDPLHWESFVRRLCDLYVQRWAKA